MLAFAKRLKIETCSLNYPYLSDQLRVERLHHLQSVCIQYVVLVDQTYENRLGLSLVLVRSTAFTSQPRFSSKRFASDDDDEDVMMTSPTADETATQRILCSWNWGG
ncbi:hypothetical protein AVEN_66408-1 [Araneus ventricosus]|uniref:Uncharacterized protein n=1 Tax=Araneus ventricosus TaxID=182803 RepID=A0A4Y2EIF0_ARAVE|nr:hypothetical protein AVEN_66408-1 [Araneus ventricosus]